MFAANIVVCLASAPIAMPETRTHPDRDRQRYNVARSLKEALMTRGTKMWMTLVMTVVVLAPTGIAAAQSPSPEISAEPVPGQLEVMQGTAVKLGGSPPAEGPQPESYEWDIVQGEGGMVYNADQAEAIFQAPTISSDIELFVIRLTVAYPDLQPAHATMHIRVHRDMPQTKEEEKRDIEDVMADYYRKESAAREANKRRVKESQARVVSHHTYSGFYGGYGYRGPGWGWGFGWGWPAYYPIYAPIVVPPPGIDWGPGDGDWGEPIAIPYDDLVTTFPEHIANDYLPQDYPGAEQVPDMGHAGGSPTDFIQVPSGVNGDFGGDGGMDYGHDPGFDAGMDFAEPMVDPGFGFDDFGW
jgi:hypothetical protein